MRLVCIDIGNTSTTLGFYEAGEVSRVVSIPGGILAKPETCADMLRLVAMGGVEGVSIASVVPKANRAWRSVVRQELGCLPRFVSSESPLGFHLDYPHAESIGADRLADAAGGLKRYGAPLIVVDFGTALNFEVLDARPAYVGGVITPGLPLMTSYLHEKTALLPEVTLGGAVPGIGKSTEEAIALGACVGYRGIVREMVAHLQKPFGRKKAKVVATGGYAAWVLDGSDLDFPIDNTLTLFGLGVIFENGGAD